MKRIILASKVVLISCMLLACTGGDGISSKASQGPTHITIVAPFSGPLSKFGRLMLRGGRMRAEEGEDHVLVSVRVVKLIALDDRRETRQAMRWFTESLR